MGEVLVTGGEGFIGSHLVRELTKDHTVHVLDKVNENGDITVRENVQRVFIENDIEKVYHLAAEADVWCSDNNHLRHNNVHGTQIIYEVAEQYNIPVVYTSSIAVREVTNMYGRTKLLGEQLAPAYEIDVKTHRLSNVVGPGIVRGQVHAMIEQALDEKKIEVWGNGTITRPYVSVFDVVNVLTSEGKHPFELGTVHMNNEQVARKIQTLLYARYGKSVDIQIVDKQPPSPETMTVDSLMKGENIEDALVEQINQQMRDKMPRGVKNVHQIKEH